MKGKIILFFLMEIIMALVGNQNTGTPVQPQASGAEPGTPKNEDEFKAAKKAAAKKHAQKVKEERQKDHEFALKLRDALKASGAWEKLEPATRDYYLAKCTPPADRVGHSGPSFFTQVFGDSPVVGAKVTLKDVITKTYKGMDTMSASIRKWATKGIDVSIEVNKQDMLATVYTITKLSA
jgi:hypothetical protein